MLSSVSLGRVLRAARARIGTAFTAGAILVATLITAGSAAGHEGPHATRPDDHAPIGVMGDHMHDAGEWMLSYRYMRMDMAGNRTGTRDVPVSAVLQDFMVAPTDMTMGMHMLGVMYAPSDWLTVMGMGMVATRDMDHVTRTDQTFSTESADIGDTTLTGLVRLYDGGMHHVHLNAGLGLPTGSIGERDDTPAMANARLPYPMQIGSGTWDLKPGITYTGKAAGLSWGGQLSGVVRLGHNDRGYALGDRFEATAWLARPVTAWFSGSLRLAYRDWGGVDGADPALNPMMVPTARADLQAGKRLDALMGVNLYAPSGALKGHRLAVEVGLPVYQDLAGPQMETDWTLTIGWQKAF